MIDLGLRAKLTLVIALLIVVFTSFFVLYVPAQQEQAAEDALRVRAESIVHAFSAMTAAILSARPGDLSRALRSFAGATMNLERDYIVVRREGPMLVAEHGWELIPTDLRDRPLARELETTDIGEYIQTRIPLKEGEAVIGDFTVGLSRGPVDRARQSSRGSAFLLSALILVLGIAASWLVGGGIATPILEAAKELDEVSNSLVAAARDQEASAAQEAAAVSETRSSMDTLLDSAQQIADRSSEVLGNAERSTNGSREIADRIGNLNDLAERVAELLGVIMQVADKADLLALNASLEGTRAGEAGKGFALVAAEMRRLAENVVESVGGIRALMQDIHEATQTAVIASQEGTKSSTATTRSAREIALLTQEQRQATEQVIASMEEMNEILTHTLNGIHRTNSSANQLTELAAKLSRMVKPSTLRRRHPSEGAPSGGSSREESFSEIRSLGAPD